MFFFSSNSIKLRRMFELFSCTGRKGCLQVHLGNGLENGKSAPLEQDYLGYLC